MKRLKDKVMSPLLISLLAFTCIFGGTFLGLFIRYRLPDRHLSGDTRDIVRQGTGVIATLASLVLGLLIASANGKFETQSSQVKQLIANIVLLDNVLKLYGSDTDGLRALMRSEIPVMAGRIWRENSSSDKEQTFEAADLGVAVYNEVLKLAPKTDAQHFLQSKAIDTITDIGKTRLLLFTNTGGSIPAPFLFVLIGWLTLIFASISLFAESGAKAVAVLFVFSLAATAAIFLILELSQPFTGLMRISDQPLRDALPALSF